MPMTVRGFNGLVLVALSLVSTTGGAAEVTDVADAADTLELGDVQRDDPFDLYLAPVDFEMTIENGKITREPINRSGVVSRSCASAQSGRDCLPVDELRYKRTTSRVKFGGQIGLFHDLALTFGTTYIASQTMKMRLAKGVTGATSSVDPTTPTAQMPTLFSVRQSGFAAKHKGFGATELGLMFGALNDERDDSKPSWVLKVAWGNPWLSKRWDPEVRATSSDPGPVGDGTHTLKFGTALSKRVGNFGLIGIDPNINRRGYLDPYMEFSYTLPIPQKGKALPELVPSNTFGRRPSHKAQFDFGMEIVGLEDLKAGRKVSIDLGMRNTFFSEGRNYSELTDALGEATYTEQYLQVGGILGLNIQAAEFIRFKTGVGFGYNTEHFLTYEEVGTDKNGDGQVNDDNKTPKDLKNPYYNDKYDQVGFRFKDEEHVIFSWYATLMFTF